jgi:hypothetical protein
MVTINLNSVYGSLAKSVQETTKLNYPTLHSGEV